MSTTTIAPRDEVIHLDHTESREARRARLSSGGLSMQSIAGTPLTLSMVLQALIVLFVAAPGLVRTLVPFLRERRAVVAGGQA